jgi:hypothetical protein
LKGVRALSIAAALALASLLLYGAQSALMTVQAGQTQGIRVQLTVNGLGIRRAFGVVLNGDPVTSVTVQYSCTLPTSSISVSLYNDAGTVIASGSSSVNPVPVSPTPPASQVALAVATVQCP